MSSHCYVGVTDLANPHVVHARFVLVNGHPAAVVPTLALIWAHHARGDAAALAAAVLAHDWEYLNPHITAAASAGGGQQPVPGVGMTLAIGSGGEPREPVSVFPLSQATHLDTGWIYLIDPATATVTVHTDDGDPVARYRLDACIPYARPHEWAQARHRPSGSPCCRRPPVGVAR